MQYTIQGQIDNPKENIFGKLFSASTDENIFGKVFLTLNVNEMDTNLKSQKTKKAEIKIVRKNPSHQWNIFNP